MRHLPRFALVPPAVLVALIPLTADAFVARAGADTASDCAAAFAAAPAAGLGYTTDPPERYAVVGQTVSLSAAWDPSAWDSLSSATACVTLDDVADDVLGTSQATPADNGAFSHSFTIPQDVPSGSRLCTRIRLAGDPAGPETQAVWVSKTHCFEVDTEVPTTTPPDTSPAPPVQPATTPGGGSPTPPTTAATTPAAASPESATPGAGTGSPGTGSQDVGVFSPEGGGSPPGTPVDQAAPPPAASATPPSAVAASAPAKPIPMLPATGSSPLTPVRAAEALFFFGLALLVLFGPPRRRRSSV
jgi:hypothetical protein